MCGEKGGGGGKRVSGRPTLATIRSKLHFPVRVDALQEQSTQKKGHRGSGDVRAELRLAGRRANSEGSWAKKVGIVLSMVKLQL